MFSKLGQGCLSHEYHIQLECIHFTSQARVTSPIGVKLKISNCIQRVGKGGMDHVSQRKKKPFHDSRVLKKQFHGKVDSNKII
jgi:predicted nucleic acid-binding OB-fold protein